MQWTVSVYWCVQWQWRGLKQLAAVNQRSEVLLWLYLEKCHIYVPQVAKLYLISAGLLERKVEMRNKSNITFKPINLYFCNVLIVFTALDNFTNIRDSYGKWYLPSNTGALVCKNSLLNSHQLFHKTFLYFVHFMLGHGKHMLS